MSRKHSKKKTSPDWQQIFDDYYRSDMIDYYNKKENQDSFYNAKDRINYGHGALNEVIQQNARKANKAIGAPIWALGKGKFDNFIEDINNESDWRSNAKKTADLILKGDASEAILYKATYPQIPAPLRRITSKKKALDLYNYVTDIEYTEAGLSDIPFAG